MRAMVITAAGGPKVLAERRRDAPVPSAGQLQVRVAATAINRADLLQLAGGYPAPPGWPADVPGIEYAGTVTARGEGVTRWQPGDRVMGLVGGGAYADYVVVHEREALPVPAGMPLTDAAAIPEAFITAHDALIEQLHLAAGESILVHAVGSGVGIAALQVATAAGARVFGTSRSAWKLERAAAYGVLSAILTGTEDFATAVLQQTDGRGVDVVMDLVGGSYLDGNLRALAPGGRLILVGLVAGARAPLDMQLLLRKRLSLRGTVLRSRSAAEKIAVTESFGAWALPRFRSGALRPVVDRVFPMSAVGAALDYVHRNASFGKVILEWEPEPESDHAPD